MQFHLLLQMSQPQAFQRPPDGPPRLPDRALRIVLAVTLIVVAVRLLSA